MSKTGRPSSSTDDPPDTALLTLQQAATLRVTSNALHDALEQFVQFH